MLPTPLNRVPTDAQQELKVRKGEAIFHQGETTGGVFYVVRGRAELRRHTESGVQVVIHRAGAGETFAEASLFSGAYHCERIEGIDEKNRVLYFTANGREKGEDPYFTHLYKINFNFRRLK